MEKKPGRGFQDNKGNEQCASRYFCQKKHFLKTQSQISSHCHVAVYPWYKNQNCLERVFINYLQTFSKRDQPDQDEGKELLLLTKSFIDPLVQAKLNFLWFVAYKMSAFFERIPNGSARSILMMFEKNQSLRQTDTVLKLLRLNVIDNLIFTQRYSTYVGNRCCTAYFYIQKFIILQVM